MLEWEYTSLTIVQSYAGKYHEFVAVCVVTSAQLSFLVSMVIMILSYEPSISLHIQMQCTQLAVPDTDSWVTLVLIFHVTCSTDTNSHVIVV